MMLNTLFAQITETISDTQEATQGSPGGDLGATFAKMMLTFVILILLLLGTYWVIRKLIRIRLERGVGTDSIQILEKKMISAKTILYLLEIENKKVLIAESQLEIKKIESFETESRATSTETS